jgi:hypothetical protein
MNGLPGFAESEGRKYKRNSGIRTRFATVVRPATSHEAVSARRISNCLGLLNKNNGELLRERM